MCLFVALFTFTLSAYSQVHPNQIKISGERFAKQDSTVSVSINFILDELNISGNDMIILTPILKSNQKKKDNLSLPAVVVAGSLRNKILNRKTNLGDNLPFESEPKTVVKRNNNTIQSVNYDLSVPYESWMDDASLSVTRVISGCADCYQADEGLLITQTIFPKKKVEVERKPVSYKLTFIVPEVEIKSRSDRHTATFNYIVDKYELLRNYKGNASEFAQVDRVIGEIIYDKNLEITEFTIAGYASPESGFEHNRILSENRANSFANYLVNKFDIARNKFTVKGFGEDWDGLRKAVAASYMTDKQAILDIIDRVSNPDLRDVDMKKLSNGETYRNLLSTYYPPLRRTEYTIAYNIRPFNVEEAREIIKTNPKLLSLNEMYLVSQSYSPSSKEFREVFDVATRIYPESDIAIINSAAADIESKNYTVAIDRLKKKEDNPKVWNNLGVAYLLNNDQVKAKEYLSKSAANGDPDAKDNLNILQENTLLNK